MELGDLLLVDWLVVCYGDVCLFNIIFDDIGCCCGYVDFGNFGVVDWWVDFVVVMLLL